LIKKQTAEFFLCRKIHVRAAGEAGSAAEENHPQFELTSLPALILMAAIYKW